LGANELGWTEEKGERREEEMETVISGVDAFGQTILHKNGSNLMLNSYLTRIIYGFLV